MSVVDTYITYVDRLRLAELISRARVRYPPVDEVERVLQRVPPWDPGSIPGDVVTMNSVVRVRDMRGGEVETLVLVYPGERSALASAAVEAREVSVFSAMGAALLGRRSGDLICWSEAGEGRTVRIEEVPYQPEARGEVG